MAFIYKGDELVTEHTKFFSQEEIRNEENEKFLRFFILGLGLHLSHNTHIKGSIIDANFQYGQEFTIHFTLKIEIDYNGGWHEYIIPCEAKNIQEEEYKIKFDGVETTYITNENIGDDINQNAYNVLISKIKEKFVSKTPINYDTTGLKFYWQ